MSKVGDSCSTEFDRVEGCGDEGEDFLLRLDFTRT